MSQKVEKVHQGGGSAKNIKKSKIRNCSAWLRLKLNTKIGVPGDIPVKLVKEFTPEITVPITKIYNRITETGEYPRQWVTEYQLAIPKVQPPLTEDDTRNIASTSFFSKQYESFIGDWIFPYIEPHIDPGQCGGLRDSSFTPYLVKLLNCCPPGSYRS